MSTQSDDQSSSRFPTDPYQIEDTKDILQKRIENGKLSRIINTAHVDHHN